MRVESQAPQVAGVGIVKSTNYSHTDHLGSGSLVTDSTGSLIEQLNYQPFGKDSVSVHTPAANGTMFATKKKFTGKEVDDDTGLYYYGARYYNPAIARFVSVDPVSRDVGSAALFTNPQRFNTYSYALNNPVKYTDPDGRAAETAWDAAVTTYDAGVLVKNVAESSYYGAMFTYYYYKGDMEKAAYYGSLNEQNVEEAKSAAVDVSLDAAATAVPFVPAGLQKVGKVADKVNDVRKAANFTEKINSKWFKSTFKTAEDSFSYHYNKHVKEAGIKNVSQEQYMQDAIDFYNKNKNLGQDVILNDGTKGLKIKPSDKGPGGYYTADGKPTTFWYE